MTDDEEEEEAFSESRSPTKLDLPLRYRMILGRHSMKSKLFDRDFRGRGERYVEVSLFRAVKISSP